MYFPYLRGRQFELIALREFAIDRGENNNVIPIIEPVKKTFNSFKLAIPKFKANDLSFALILNPAVGEKPSVSEILYSLESELSDAKWIPAFIVGNNITQIKDVITDKQLQKVMLICSDNIDTSTEEFLSFVLSDEVEYVVSKSNRTLKRKLKDTDKKLVQLDDRFEARKRNSDYLNVEEEKFTEEHLFYDEDNYYGFADYTTVTSEFNEGGSTPFAVAIHLTYEKENDEIWIRHFTSVSNDDRANIQGKFSEAAQKAIQFLNEENIETNAAEELKEYYRMQKYPGLGTVKKISIKNHLELVNSLL